MRRIASEVPTTPIEIAKSCSTADKELCDPEEGLDEDEDAVPDVVPVMLLVCDVEEIVDEVLEGSRTSKLNHNKSIFSRFPKDDGQLT